MRAHVVRIIYIYDMCTHAQCDMYMTFASIRVRELLHVSYITLTEDTKPHQLQEELMNFTILIQHNYGKWPFVPRFTH